MQTTATPFGERQFMVRPFLFNGDNYPYWIKRMEMFIEAHDIGVWNIILEGFHMPTKIIDEKMDVKSRTEWDDKDKKLVQLNAKVVNILYYAKDPKSSIECQCVKMLKRCRIP